MIEIAKGLPESRRELFREASSRSGLSFDIIQKDFWVCFVLDRLFSHQDIGQKIYFKGGTSLSKCFNLIERFSEDVDLTVRRSAIGFDDSDLLAAPTKNQLKRSRKSIRETAFDYAATTILPALEASLAAVLHDGASWKLIDRGAGVISFQFPADPDLTIGSYLAPEVKLEIGGLSDLEPNGIGQVTPYAAETVPESFTQKTTDVAVVLAQRTLCDKLLLLHRLNTSGEDLPAENSRHFYDVAMMVDSSVRQELLDNPGLLARAIEYEGKTFPRAGMDYSRLHSTDLTLSPPDTILPSLRADYGAMREMFFSAPPSLEEIGAALRRLEGDLQAL